MSARSTAGDRWKEALAAWAIPEDILAAAPESPWSFPVELFASRADASDGPPTVSNARAYEALPPDGTVLDVGCGAGAASLPLAERAGMLVGVDTSQDMLAAFEERGARKGVRTQTLRERWPDGAARAPITDVVVCHHVFYNAPDLPEFALALTDHARRRVVVELTATHPQSSLNNLWLHFHGLQRPTVPTADDAVAVLRELGFEPERIDWKAPFRGGFSDRRDLIAWVRRRLCLPADRDPEIEQAIGDRVVEHGGLSGFLQQTLVTLWWDGRA